MGGGKDVGGDERRGAADWRAAETSGAQCTPTPPQSRSER